MQGGSILSAGPLKLGRVWRKSRRYCMVRVWGLGNEGKDQRDWCLAWVRMQLPIVERRGLGKNDLVQKCQCFWAWGHQQVLNSFYIQSYNIPMVFVVSLLLALILCVTAIKQLILLITYPLTLLSFSAIHMCQLDLLVSCAMVSFILQNSFPILGESTVELLGLIKGALPLKFCVQWLSQLQKKPYLTAVWLNVYVS